MTAPAPRNHPAEDAHPAPTPAPVAVPEGGWRAHEIVGTQKVSQGVAQTVPEDVVLCVTCGWLRCSEYLTHLLALPRPEPVAAPLPGEADVARLAIRKVIRRRVEEHIHEHGYRIDGAPSLIDWTVDDLCALIRLVPEDDEDTVRVPRSEVKRLLGERDALLAEKDWTMSELIDVDTNIVSVIERALDGTR